MQFLKRRKCRCPNLATMHIIFNVNNEESMKSEKFYYYTDPSGRNWHNRHNVKQTAMSEV